LLARPIIHRNREGAMSDQPILIYATEWCWDCRRVRRFLDKHQVAYRWINIDQDKAAEAFVLKTNQGMRSVPTLVLGDGSTLVEPSIHTLAETLQIDQT
jgi:glutaredoxin-like protein